MSELSPPISIMFSMRRFKLFVIPFCIPLLLLAQSADGAFGGFVSAEERDAALQAEADLVFAAKEAAAAGRDEEADAKLAVPSRKEFKAEASATLMFRAASACAWLLNEGKREAAEKLARRTLHAVKKSTEVARHERVSRLYWEAWLWAEVLDDKKAGLDLLDAASRLAPDDSRILYSRQRWTAAGKGGKS